jgi:hypothetical protein
VSSQFQFLSLLVNLPEVSGSNPQRHLVAKEGGLGEKWLCIFPTKYLINTPQGSLTCRKILRYGADGFTSPPKETMLRIFYRLRPFFNPRFSCPMASTITTIPPRPTNKTWWCNVRHKWSAKVNVRGWRREKYVLLPWTESMLLYRSRFHGSSPVPAYGTCTKSCIHMFVMSENLTRPAL